MDALIAKVYSVQLGKDFGLILVRKFGHIVLIKNGALPQTELEIVAALGHEVLSRFGDHQ